MNMQGISASQFVGPFLDIVQSWEKKMQIIGDVLEAWIQLQNKWMYLEGIFVESDIRIQLPEEAKMFDEIDSVYKKIMNDTSQKLNVLECCILPGNYDKY